MSECDALILLFSGLKLVSVLLSLSTAAKILMPSSPMRF